MKVTAPLTELILIQSKDYPYELLCKQLDAKNNIKSNRRKLCDSAADGLKDSLTPSLQRAMSLTMEKGASSWLTVLPLEEHHFALHKQAFRDALALRYCMLASHSHPNKLFLWPTILSATCTLMPKRWIPINPAY